MDSAWFLKKISGTCKLDPTGLVIVGVSGGPDSITLLHLLLTSKIPCVAAHFDHGLRRESGADATFVSDYCRETGIQFVLGRGDVKLFAKNQHISVEESARELRYRFLFEQAITLNANAVLVAHNWDDQVETIMMHLIRGTGMSGLSGMRQVLLPNPWSNLVPLVRPFLNVSRSGILEYIQQNNLKTILDSSNADTRFFRNRIRKELVPQLVSYNPSFKERIHKMGEVIALEDEFLSAQVDVFWNENQLGRLDHMIVLDRKRALGLHRALLRRLIRRMISHLNRGMRNIDFDTVEKAVDFINSGNHSNHFDLFAGMEMFLALKNSVIMIAKGSFMDELWPQMQTSESFTVPLEGEVHIGRNWKLLVKRVPDLIKTPDSYTCSISMKNLKDPLTIRCAKQGDRFTPFGMEGKSKKLGDFWTNEGLPVRARKRWPLLCNGEDIVWVPGFRISEDHKVGDDPGTILNLSLVKTK